MKAPNWARNISGDIAYYLLSLTYPRDQQFYAITWLAAKTGHFDLINQHTLLNKILHQWTPIDRTVPIQKGK